MTLQNYNISYLVYDFFNFPNERKLTFYHILIARSATGLNSSHLTLLNGKRNCCEPVTLKKYLLRGLAF